MLRLRTFASLWLVITSTSALAAPTHHLQPQDFNRQPLESFAPYPKAKTGMTRQIIALTPRAHEENFRIELLIGKNIEVDCNSATMSATLHRETLSGWGFDYWVVNSLSEPASTLMACPNQETHPQFIRAALGDKAFLRYNSRLPIVVYVPQGVEVKYRIWSVSEATHTAHQG